jgi:predicted nucleotidyltransferase
MASVLPTLAREIGVDERTLRRAARRGAVRCQRPGPRRLELAAGEREYLRDHWGLLSALTRALRTEANVSLAVLYGSAARGDDRADSDIDLLIVLREDRPGAASALAQRLQRAVGRNVDVARLARVERQAPLLLLYALDDGRVLVDRDERWPVLQARRIQVSRAARRDRKLARQQAAESLRMLIEDDA